MIQREVRGQRRARTRSGRGCAPTCRSPARRTAAPRTASRPPCCGPSSATAMPMKPTCEIWMSLVAMRNCQPSTSSAPPSPANSAAERHRHDVVARDRDARRARRLRVEADRAHLVAEHGAVEQHPEDEHAASAMKSPTCRPCSCGSPQNTGSFALAATSLETGIDFWVVVLQRPAEAEQVDADPDRDPVEHDRRDHLVGAGRSPSAARRSPPTAAPASAGRHASRAARAARAACPRTTSPTQTADDRAHRYWPWPPMLNSPQRNANATASPVRISGVVAISVCWRLIAARASRVAASTGRTSSARCRRRSPCRSTSGLWPVSSTTRPPTTNASSTVISGVTIPPRAHVAREPGGDGRARAASSSSGALMRGRLRALRARRRSSPRRSPPRRRRAAARRRSRPRRSPARGR